MCGRVRYRKADWASQSGPVIKDLERQSRKKNNNNNSQGRKKKKKIEKKKKEKNSLCHDLSPLAPRNIHNDHPPHIPASNRISELLTRLHGRGRHRLDDPLHSIGLPGQGCSETGAVDERGTFVSREGVIEGRGVGGVAVDDGGFREELRIDEIFGFLLGAHVDYDVVSVGDEGGEEAETHFSSCADEEDFHVWGVSAG